MIIYGSSSAHLYFQHPFRSHCHSWLQHLSVPWPSDCSIAGCRSHPFRCPACNSPCCDRWSVHDTTWKWPKRADSNKSRLGFHMVSSCLIMFDVFENQQRVRKRHIWSLRELWNGNSRPRKCYISQFRAGACSCQHPNQSRLVIDCADSLRLMKKEAEQNATLDRAFMVVHQTIQISGFSYKFSRYSRSECLSWAFDYDNKEN